MTKQIKYNQIAMQIKKYDLNYDPIWPNLDHF